MESEEIKEEEKYDNELDNKIGKETIKNVEKIDTQSSYPQVNTDDLRITIERQNEEIKGLKEKLNELFKNNAIEEAKDELEEYFDSEESITGRLLRRAGYIKEEK